MRLAKDETIVVKGVHYKVPLSSMPLGSSFFIPVLDTKRARARLGAMAQEYNRKLSFLDSTELGMLGVRAWRVL